MGREKREFYPRPRKVVEKGKGNIEETDKPEPWKNSPFGDAGCEDVYAGLAGVFPYSRNEKNHARLERMASPADMDVHMVAMEEAKDEGGQPEEAGDSRREGLHVE